jgi:hypothetical protein
MSVSRANMNDRAIIWLMRYMLFCGGLVAFTVIGSVGAAPVECGGDDSEKVAITKIEALGGYVRKNDRSGNAEAITIHDGVKNLTDADIEAVDFASLPKLNFLFINGEELSDRSLSHLAKSPNKISHLWLTMSPKVTDSGIAKLLKEQKSLWSLTLSNSAIGDESLAEIGAMRDLRILTLAYTKISDKGAKHLGKLAGLAFLSLSGAEISDSGLLEVASCAKLSTLHVRDTGISKECEAALQQKLPKLKIVR